MGYSKAGFKAARELCGLSQLDVANACDVRVLAVKKWEKPGGAEPPQDAWDFLESCIDAQNEAVECAMSAAIARGGAVQIAYYRSQAQYDDLGSDPGPYGMANANARLVAHRLRALGFHVDFSYPDDGNENG
ncbi:MAG: hypothetical protein RR772_08860 [Gordonibacter sp.]